MPLLRIAWFFAVYTAAETLNAFYWAGQPSKLPLSAGISTPSNTWFLGPHICQPPNGISIGSAFFCIDHPCDQHTDTQTQTTLRVTSVAMGRMHCMCAMRPNNTSDYVVVMAKPLPEFIRYVWWLKLRLILRPSQPTRADSKHPHPPSLTIYYYYSTQKLILILRPTESQSIAVLQ